MLPVITSTEKVGNIIAVRIPLLPLLLLMSAAASLGASHGQAADMAPHRAFYTVALLDSADGGMMEARGAAMIGVERTCDAWIMTTQMSTVLTTAAGQSLEQTLRFAGWESLENRTYRFASRSRFADTREDFKGQAEVAADGSEGSVTYKVPRDGTLALPAGTRFPMSHLIHLIQRAEAGERMVSDIVFDGTESVGPRRVTVFIGKLRPAAEPGEESLGDLVRHSGWTMRAAYFPLGGQAAEPDYEVELLQLGNGVVSRMVADYRIFKVLLTLERVEAVPPPRC